MIEENEMGMPSNDELNQWAAELDDIDAQIAKLNERRTLIRQVLDTRPAIEKLRGNLPLVPEDKTPEMQDTSLEPPKLVHAIAMVLERYQRPMTPAEIKTRLKEVGYLKGFNDTYFYSAIRRGLEKKTLTKTGNGVYQSIRKSSIGFSK